jgi:hypothetical protein
LRGTFVFNVTACRTWEGETERLFGFLWTEDTWVCRVATQCPVAYFDTNYFTFYFVLIVLVSHPPFFLLHIKHLFGLSPPSRSLCAPLRPLNWRFLHSIRHGPPLLHLFVGGHACHILVKRVSDVFKRGEESGSRREREEYRV